MQRCILCAILVASIVIGCTKEPPTSDSIAVITPETLSLEAAASGGSYTLAYEIENPISGAPLVAEADKEWVYDVDTTVAGIVSFTVLCNDTAEPREAIITLRYPSAEIFPEVKVQQAGITEEQLTINITNIDYSECTAKISPINNEMQYVVMMAEKSYFETAGIVDARSLIETDESRFRSLMTESDSLEEFLQKSNIARKGECTQRWEDISPAKEYVIYTYGISIIDDTYHRTTPIYYNVIGSRLPERRDIGFDVEVAGDSVEVSVTVTPRDWSGYYMVQFVEDSEAGFIPKGTPFTEENEIALAESFFYLADHLYYFNELTADEVMSQLGHRGTHTLHKTLNANHEYMVMVYAIASDDGNVPMVVSHPTIEYLSTGGVERSDITFDVAITNIRPRSVDIAITPSNDDPYTAVVMYASNLPAGSKDEQLDYIVDHYAPLEMSGYYEEHLDQLPPNTKFILAVYGFYAGAPTTNLFLYEFATAKDDVGDNTITEVRCTAYDLAEVIALEPYYSSYLQYADYFLSVEVFTAEPSPTLHFDIFARSVVEEYGLEAIRESLLDYSYTSSPDWALCTYDNEYVICGLAEDSAGYVGEMYISEPVTFSREQTSDASEFVELYKEYVN